MHKILKAQARKQGAYMFDAAVLVAQRFTDSFEDLRVIRLPEWQQIEALCEAIHQSPLFAE